MNLTPQNFWTTPELFPIPGMPEGVPDAGIDISASPAPAVPPLDVPAGAASGAEAAPRQAPAPAAPALRQAHPASLSTPRPATPEPLPEPAPIRAALETADVSAAQGLSDRHLAELLDVTEEVVRENRERAKTEYAARLAAAHPGLDRWLTQDPVHAARFKENPGWFSDLLRTVGEIYDRETDALATSWDLALLQQEMAVEGAALRGGDDSALERIRVLRGKVAALQVAGEDSWLARSGLGPAVVQQIPRMLDTSAKSGAEALGMGAAVYGAATLAGLGTGAAVGSVVPGAGTAAGGAGGALLSQPAAVRAGMTAAGMTYAVRQGQRTFDLERGLFIADLAFQPDAENRPLPADVRNAAGDLYGLTAAAIEAGGDLLLFNLLKPVLNKALPEKLGGEGLKNYIKSTLRRAVLDPAARRPLLRVAAKINRSALLESFQEISQEFAAIVGEVEAKKWSNAHRGTTFTDTDVFTAEHGARLRTAGILGYEGGIFFNGVPVGISRLAQAHHTRAAASFSDSQTAVHRAVEASPLKKTSPDDLESLLRLTRGMEDDVLLPASALLDLRDSGVDLLSPLGLTEEQAVRAGDGDLAVPLAAVHARLDAARFEQAARIMRRAPDSPNALDAATQAAMDREVERLRREMEAAGMPFRAAADNAAFHSAQARTFARTYGVDPVALLQRRTVRRATREDVRGMREERGKGETRLQLSAEDIAAAKAALERDAQAWGKTIDAIVASKKKPSRSVLMLKQTPLVMHLLGADFQELHAAPHMFDGIFPDSKPRNPNHHAHTNITPDVLKQIAKAMADPIMVFDSDKGGGRLLFMLEVRDANGATVIVPVELEGRGNHRKRINILTSAFAKERQGIPDNMWFVKQARVNLRYINQKKTERWSRSSRVRCPFVRLSNASGKKILTQDDLVKLKEAHPGLYQPGREDAPIPEPPLMVMHNLHPNQLAEVLRLGGLPSPSLGVPNAHVPYGHFGPITLIGPSSLADPQKTLVFARDGWTPSTPKGDDDRPIPVKNLDEAVERMTSPAAWRRRGLYGTGLLLADTAGLFRNMDQLKDARHDLTNHEQTLRAIETFETNFDDFSEDLLRHYGGGEKPADPKVRARLESNIGRALKDAYQFLHPEKFPELKNKKKHLPPDADPATRLTYELGRRGIRDIPPALLEEGLLLLEEIGEVPTGFFESKPQRAVGLEEFAGAVVPKGTDPKLIQGLRDAGLEVREYAGEEHYETTIAEMAEELHERRGDILFQNGRREENAMEHNAAPDGETQDGATRRATAAPKADDVAGLSDAEAASPRGAVFLSPERADIVLFDKADLSTLPHEASHIFLDDLLRVAESFTEAEAADPLRRQGYERARADLGALRRWCGLPEEGTLTKEQLRHLHERTAEGFEQYLMEGRAPSPELRGVFARMKQWLTQIYVQARDHFKLPINDDVRRVFDRMLEADAGRGESTGTIREMTGGTPGGTAGPKAHAAMPGTGAGPLRKTTATRTGVTSSGEATGGGETAPPETAYAQAEKKAASAQDTPEAQRREQWRQWSRTYRRQLEKAGYPRARASALSDVLSAHAEVFGPLFGQEPEAWLRERPARIETATLDEFSGVHRRFLRERAEKNAKLPEGERKDSPYYAPRVLYFPLNTGVDPKTKLTPLAVPTLDKPATAYVKGEGKSRLIAAVGGRYANPYYDREGKPLAFTISRQGINHFINSFYKRGLGGDVHIAAMLHAPELFARAVPVEIHRDRKKQQDVRKIHHLFAPMHYGDAGDVYAVHFIVKELDGERRLDLESVHKLYDLHVEKPTEDRMKAILPAKAGAPFPKQAFPDITLRDLLRGVNDADSVPYFWPRSGSEPKVRGAISWSPADDAALITLFRGRKDLPTIIHEGAGHFFLENLRAAAQLNTAPRWVRRDWDTLAKVIGAPAKLHLGIPDKAHEKFARMAVDYFRRGNAPSEILRDVFRNFARWLSRIYRSARRLVDLEDISPEVERIMGRLIATEEDLAAARREPGAGKGPKGGATSAE